MITPSDTPTPDDRVWPSGAGSRPNCHVWRAIRLAVGLVALMLVIIGVAAISRQLGSRATIHTIPKLPTPLRAAHEHCAAGVVLDRGRALYLDTAGDLPGSGDLVMADVTCVLHALRAPSHILDQIEGTRARHGQQAGHWVAPTDMWASYVFWASWSYEPGSGLDIAIAGAPNFESGIPWCLQDRCRAVNGNGPPTVNQRLPLSRR